MRFYWLFYRHPEPCYSLPISSVMSTRTLLVQQLYLAIIQRCNAVAIAAPMNCAAMNAGVSAGRMPEKVSVNERARVTAGLANDVDAVNQYAAVI